MRLSVSRLTKAVLTLAAAVLWSNAVSSVARADEFYDFSTGLGGLKIYDPFDSLGSNATITAPGADGTLRIQNNAAPNPPLSLPEGAARAGVYGSQGYTDFSASLDVVNWDSSLSQYAALGARMGEVGLGSTDGYQAAIQFMNNPMRDAFVTIYRVDNESLTALGGTIFTYNPARDYRINFQGVGSDLSLSILELSSGFPDRSVGGATVKDATYSSGAVGAFAVGSDFSAEPVDITFDNLSVTALAAAVPEPGTVGLLVIGLGVGTVIVRRSRRSVLKAVA